MEDVRFHQCVRLTRFESDRTISFIPPDGEFELMHYRISAEFKPLVWVEATVQEHSGSRLEYTVKLRSQYKRRSTANGVEITVPVSDDVSSPKFKVSSPSSGGPLTQALMSCAASQAAVGTVVYHPEKSAFVWKLKQLPGGKDLYMSANFSLPSIRGGAGSSSASSPRHPLTPYLGTEEAEKRVPITVTFEIPCKQQLLAPVQVVLIHHFGTDFTVSGIQVRYLKVIEKSGYKSLPWVRYITRNGDDCEFTGLSVGERHADPGKSRFAENQPARSKSDERG